MPFYGQLTRHGSWWPLKLVSCLGYHETVFLAPLLPPKSHTRSVICCLIHTQKSFARGLNWCKEKKSNTICSHPIKCPQSRVWIDLNFQSNFSAVVEKELVKSNNGLLIQHYSTGFTSNKKKDLWLNEVHLHLVLDLPSDCSSSWTNVFSVEKEIWFNGNCSQRRHDLAN